MSDPNGKQVFQCQNCGTLHKVETKYDIEGDLFVELRCPKCRDETKHLWCGTEDEQYEMYNVNIDPRYY